MVLTDDEEDRMSEKLSSEQRKALAGIEELHRIDLEASRTGDFEWGYFSGEVEMVDSGKIVRLLRPRREKIFWSA